MCLPDTWPEKGTHLWLPSIFLGRRQLLIWPKGVNSAVRSFLVASNATFLTTSLVPLPLLPGLPSCLPFWVAWPPAGLRMLSCSASL